MGSTKSTIPQKNALEVGIDPSRFGYERTVLPIGPSRILYLSNNLLSIISSIVVMLLEYCTSTIERHWCCHDTVTLIFPIQPKRSWN
jgi:hypothetical protein